MPSLTAAFYLSALFMVMSVRASETPEKIQFNRDIRPILSENCFHCHGQDANHREAKLRLDERDDATRDRDGFFIIAPGKPDESELIARLLSKDPDEQMPPPTSNKHVTPEQTALLRRWVAEGAAYEKHWAFLAPVRAPNPKIELTSAATVQHLKSKIRNPLDTFVLARLEAEKLAPSPAAAPETWLRRVSFDLTGLPPTPAEIDAFASDVIENRESAFENAVDRLLASPHFGERQAIEWLDAARYADTHGFNNDSSRTMWRWRDWVIDAFNANLPYDRFITEQIAGDLLPQPTLEQRIATGFARNHVISSEGGIIEEEYRVEYVADRVRTLSTAWLGLTMECAKCHDHKFDPVTQRDYYRLFAFFNQTSERGEDGRVANAVPMIPAPTRAQQETLAEQTRELAALDAQLAPARTAWQWRPADPARLEPVLAAARAKIAADPGVALLPTETDPTGIAGSAWRPDLAQPAPKVAATAFDFRAKSGLTLAFWLNPDVDIPRDVALFSAINYVGSADDSTYGRGRELRLIDGEIELRLSERYPAYAVVVRTVGAAIRPGQWRHVAVAYSGGKNAAGVRCFIDGQEQPVHVLFDGLPGEPKQAEFLLGADNAPAGSRWRGALDEARSFPRALDAAAVRARFQSEALPYAAVRAAAGITDAVTLGWLRDTLLADAEPTRALSARRTVLHETHLALHRSLPTAMIMDELPEPRPTFVLDRGNYNAPGEPVTAGVPEALLSTPWPVGAPHNRLGLARWLTQPDHPLTARVVVNRFWAQLFGTGLVKTLEDFGYQSEWPSHPELLDTLARDFIDGGWNTKALLKTIVLSATYRQSSATTPALTARDPENRLLARGPRVRLPAELIRDQALAVSGLLTPQIGGPSVYPYQPEKLYEGIVVDAPYPSTKWGVSTGADLHRRSLYTFWKRTIPHPAMTTFDAPDREFCSVRRARTNTPLQALALWNEPGTLEAARQLGTRMVREGGTDDSARVAFAFRLATGRRPKPTETAVLTKTLTQLRSEFTANGSDAYAFVKIGASPMDPLLPPAELAAHTAIASMILSLDETITKN